jgi:hypothetical protein
VDRGTRTKEREREREREKEQQQQYTTIIKQYIIMPRVQISVSVEGLRGSSIFGTSKPYAILRITGGPLQGTPLGRTEV